MRSGLNTRAISASVLLGLHATATPTKGAVDPITVTPFMEKSKTSKGQTQCITND